MKITNIIKDSFQEYQNEHSLVLFTQGCNLDCSRCHNRKDMWSTDTEDSVVIIEKILTPLHTAVVFLGGEPTLVDHDLVVSCMAAKKQNKKVKVFTNGQKPEIIRKLLFDL